MIALLAAALPSLAGAAGPAAWWQIDAQPAPTVMQPGHQGFIDLEVLDVGNEEVGPPVTVTDLVPSGLKVEATRLRVPFKADTPVGLCTTSAQAGGATLVTCTYEPPPPNTGLKLPAFESLELRITVAVEAAAGSLPNDARVEGAGRSAEDTGPITVGDQPTPFGIERFAMSAEDEGGAPDRQAGSHPFQLSTDLEFDETAGTLSEHLEPEVPALVRDVQVTLPAGLVGDASAVPACPDLAFSTVEPDQANRCPANTVVGVANVSISEPSAFHYIHRAVPLFNLTPAPGEPVRLGFEVLKAVVVVDTSVLTGGSYAAVASVRNATEGVQILGSQVFIWGEPGSAPHDAQRGWHCLLNGHNQLIENNKHEACAPEESSKQNGEVEVRRPEHSFLQMPTACGETLESSVQVDSWTSPGPQDADQLALGGPPWVGASSHPPALEGCDQLAPLFEPSLDVVPETTAGGTPTGGDLIVRLPQTGTTGIEHDGVPALTTPAVREATVTMPEGMLLSPSVATGLEACSEGLVGFSGLTTPHDQSFTRDIPAAAELEPGVNFCPDGAKVGTVKIRTPDLPNAIEGGQPERPGGVFLACSPASPAAGECPDPASANPFGSLYAIYMVAQDPVSKVTVKVAGEIKVDPANGQVTATFRDTPEVPFEELTVHLFGGPRAAFTTPAQCGTYTVKSTFVPWSGTAPREASSSFEVTSGAEGSPCAAQLPLTPGFSAGSASPQAGAFTSFETTITHPDADAPPTALSMTLPPGLAAMLPSVELCPEPQAQQGTCTESSQIGEATALSGLGSEPFTASGGRVYITGPYDGAPFGLSIVLPAKAGPFDFGQVVTRASLSVDPTTAAVTIASALPTFVNTDRYQTGVPVQLKAVHVVVDRPGFQFNPTNCSPQEITGQLTGAGGVTAPLTQRFQAANCGSLPFAPGLVASTTGTFSRANGTAFTVAVTAKRGEANIAKARLVIPKQLPSRLTTLQKACPDNVFNANPASCGEASDVGYAVVHTPVLRSPLAGPAYLVSHGNAAFPDLEFVLQGENVKLVLDGQTNVHNGVTTSTFNAVPDAPVTSFEAVFPAGPHSILTGYSAKGTSLCSEHLVIPTTMIGQNGKLVERMTPVAFTGCGKHGVKPSKSRRSTLGSALARCRHEYRHRRTRRERCERGARARAAARRHRARAR
ncbi:MAG TPA: hypothetical protein VHT27_13780 [Solirubrobacteraceae bacterium]|nr:hypothetical protein [Solirubrobacteraceae bacterium]